jgi:hypothetical protein
VIPEIRVILAPKATREKLESDTLVMPVLREIKEILELKVKSELETQDLRVIRGNWVSIKKYFLIVWLYNYVIFKIEIRNY